MKNRHSICGKYVQAFSWPEEHESFIRETVCESPLLNVCSGPDCSFGNVRVDLYVKPIPPSVIADWLTLPFASNSFAAVFADPPWTIGYMKACADFCKEALRIAPVVYVLSPWLWVSKNARRRIWVREMLGINQPVLLVRFERL